MLADLEAEWLNSSLLSRQWPLLEIAPRDPRLASRRTCESPFRSRSPLFCSESVPISPKGNGAIKQRSDRRLPDALTGFFYIFSKINFDDPWLNTARNAEATEDELEQLNIPEHLAPEFRRFRYIFDPHKHRLFFEIYTRDRDTISIEGLVRFIRLS
ncbi:MAG TPA: DUF4747 family protein [Rhizomicrobium sp.]|nr:DUF4747 family protein [Rhizomicrobium sp.]